MYRRILAVTSMLVLVGAAICPQLSAADETEKKLPAILRLDARQRQLLSAAKTWKIKVAHNYPHNPKEKSPISVQEDCERLLQAAGWKVDADGGTVVLRITVNGKADWNSYHATPSKRYSGAEVTIDAAITTTDSPPKTILPFSSVKGEVGTPWSIGGGYLTPSDAPFGRAYKECRGFRTQLLSIVHAVKGAKVAYESGNAGGSDFRAALFAVIEAGGDRSFVPLLIDDLVSGRGSVEVFADCLGALGDAQAVDPLCMSLVDKDGDVWEPAARALGKLGDSKAIPHLRTALLGTNSHPRLVASALRELKWRPETAKEKVVCRLALDEPEKVKEMKAEAVPVLIELLSAEKWAACTAAQLLGELHEASAVVSLSRSLLGGKGEWRLRQATATSLSEIGGPNVVEPLAMALMSDDDSNVREACASGLGKAGGEVSVKSLVQALASDKDDGVRVVCATELGKTGGALAVKSLAKALASDEDNDVRRVCAVGLGKAGGELVIKSLVQAMLKDKDHDVVITAVDTLGQLKALAAVDCLIKGLDHENSGVRAHAVVALGLIGDDRAVAAIGDRLKKETDQQAQQAMVRVLAELGAQPETLPFEARLGLLAKQKNWEQLRDFLKEQPTEKVIESLKLENELVNKVARFILAQRTGKYDLQTYDDWKQWWKLNGGKPSTGETAEPRSSKPQK